MDFYLLANKIIFMSRILFSIIFLLSFFILPGEKSNGICQPERVWRPFDIEKSPDYLYMDGVNGYCYLQLYISKKGIIIKFKIQRLFLKNGKDTVLYVDDITPHNKIINKQYRSIDIQGCYDSIKKYVDQIILKPTIDTAEYGNIIPCWLHIKVRGTPIPKYSSEMLNNYFSKKDSANINSIILYGRK